MGKNVLSEKQAQFLRDEFGMDVAVGKTLDLDREKKEELITAVLTIECDEAEKQYPLAERGKIAVSILDEHLCPIKSKSGDPLP